jgi:hypothetical protein
MKTAKMTSAPARQKPLAAIRALLDPAAVLVRRVDRARLNRLAGCWPAAEADRMAAFIEENCEAAHEEN